MNQKYIRSLLYGLVFLIISHDLTIAQETTTEKVPADPKQKEALFFYWKSEIKDLMEQKKGARSQICRARNQIHSGHGSSQSRK